MTMDGSFQMDLPEIIENIKNSEVICFHFPYLRKTLIVDTRSDVEDPPLLRVVPMAKSIEDRFRSIRRMRPRFKNPEKVTIIPWPRYVDSLKSLGVWDHLAKRLVDSGHPDSLAASEDVFVKLRKLEMAEFTAAITGKQYHTIWERPKT